MAGHEPWQAPHERSYTSGQGSSSSAPPRPPGRSEQPRKEKPGKESKLVAFREWLSTTVGAISAICAIITLISGTVVAVRILDKNPTAATPTPNRTSQNNQTSPVPIIHNSAGSFSVSQLQSALLPSSTVGSTALVVSRGTDLSQIEAICGGPVSGDTAAAYETIKDSQSGTILDEALVSWDNTSGPSQGIATTRQTIDQNGSCSVTSNGVTTQYTGDEPGSPPSSCVSPGQYLATQVEVTSPSSTFPYFGFTEIVQCGATTIFVRVYSDVPGAITQTTADGYLSSAVGNLESNAS